VHDYTIGNDGKKYTLRQFLEQPLGKSMMDLHQFQEWWCMLQQAIQANDDSSRKLEILLGQNVRCQETQSRFKAFCVN
jgi:hypothetical protein